MKYTRTANSLEDYAQAGCTELEMEAVKTPVSELSKEGALLAFSAMAKLREMYMQENKSEAQPSGDAPMA